MEQIHAAKGLKIFSIVVAIAGIAFFFLYMPILVDQAVAAPKGMSWLQWPITIIIWIVALFCYLALFEFYKICNQIGKDNSFSNENATSMKKISNYAFIAAAIILVGTGFCSIVGFLHLFMIIKLVFTTFAAIGIGILSYALAKLIKYAADIKQENDLTV